MTIQIHFWDKLYGSTFERRHSICNIPGTQGKEDHQRNQIILTHMVSPFQEHMGKTI